MIEIEQQNTVHIIQIICTLKPTKKKGFRGISPLCLRTKWHYYGRISPVERGVFSKRFLTPLACSTGCRLTGWKAAFSRAERSRTPPDLPEQAAFHPVSRQLAQTSGVRKRLPFSLCIGLAEPPSGTYRRLVEAWPSMGRFQPLWAATSRLEHYWNARP